MRSAAINGHLEVVKYLVEHGADIGAADTAGCTALNGPRGGVILRWSSTWWIMGPTWV